MAFRLHRDDDDATALLRRLAAEELGAIGAGTGAHDARKRIKKMRAALRLVQAGLPAARQESAALGHAAQGLAGQRDAEVMLAVLNRLAGPDDAPALRARLSDRALADPDAARAAFLAALAPVLDRAQGWQVRGKTAQILHQGLARTRRRALAAMAKARLHGPDSEAMHDWRKRIKDLWYQARLFQPVWPAAMDPVVTAAGDLGEALGDHHDLTVFCSLIGDLAADPAADPALAAEAAPLLARAAEEQQAIARQARTDGARLLAGDPDAAAALWVTWWRLWRSTG
jgi:CHAD domain-containing protein